MITVNEIQYLTPVTNKTRNESIKAFRALSTEAYLTILPLLLVLVLATPTSSLSVLKTKLDIHVLRKTFFKALGSFGSWDSLLQVCFVTFISRLYGDAWIDGGVIDWEGIYDNFDGHASFGLGVSVALVVFAWKMFFALIVPRLVIVHVVFYACIAIVRIVRIANEFLYTTYLDLKEEVKESVEMWKDGRCEAVSEWHEEKRRKKDVVRDGYTAPPPSPVFCPIR